MKAIFSIFWEHAESWRALEFNERHQFRISKEEENNSVLPHIQVLKATFLRKKKKAHTHTHTKIIKQKTTWRDNGSGFCKYHFLLSTEKDFLKCVIRWTDIGNSFIYCFNFEETARFSFFLLYDYADNRQQKYKELWQVLINRFDKSRGKTS